MKPPKSEFPRRFQKHMRDLAKRRRRDAEVVIKSPWKAAQAQALKYWPVLAAIISIFAIGSAFSIGFLLGVPENFRFVITVSDLSEQFAIFLLYISLATLIARVWEIWLDTMLEMFRDEAPPGSNMSRLISSAVRVASATTVAIILSGFLGGVGAFYFFVALALSCFVGYLLNFVFQYSAAMREATLVGRKSPSIRKGLILQSVNFSSRYNVRLAASLVVILTATLGDLRHSALKSSSEMLIATKTVGELSGSIILSSSEGLMIFETIGRYRFVPLHDVVSVVAK